MPDRGGQTDERMREMLRGMATVSLFADDLAAATDWYATLLGVEPYFVRPVEGPAAYVEFRFGDYQHELGIIDRRWAPHQDEKPGGAVLFWHVDDIDAALDRLVAMGAAVHEARTSRGAGFVTASVVDPFGNVLGVMYNPHYLDILSQAGGCDGVDQEGGGARVPSDDEGVGDRGGIGMV
jgi:predicted enzyme related to lactoylglutathione lyase